MKLTFKVNKHTEVVLDGEEGLVHIHQVVEDGEDQTVELTKAEMDALAESYRTEGWKV